MVQAPLVSLVIPAYNAAPFIAETIESAVAQSYPEIEIIVVDDGSTDETGAIAQRYAPRVRIHRQDNAGQSAALETGWTMARGPILGYLSADDRLKPMAVALAVEALESRPDVVLAYPDFDVIDEFSARRSTVAAPDFSREALYADLKCLPGPGAFFRRTAYDQAGPWRRDLRQIPDLDFFLRLALVGDFHHIPQSLAEFRLHSGSTTYSVVPAERGDEPLSMLSEFFDRPALPADVQGWKRRARANGLLLSAIIHGQSGRTWLACRRVGQAALTAPSEVISMKAFAYCRGILKGVGARAN